jgi:hypothetical protein
MTMSQRLKITLSDAVMAELRGIAVRDGVPIARVAAERLSRTTPADQSSDSESALPALIDDDLTDDRHAPWIEPVMGDIGWRRRMWGSIAALYGRYPRQLAYLREGWWKDSSHIETLCALVVWRDWIDVAAEDPRQSWHSKLSSPTLANSSDRKAAALRRPGSQGRRRPSGSSDESSQAC